MGTLDRMRLWFLLTFALISCGGDEPEPAAEPASSTPATTPTTPEGSTTATPEAADSLAPRLAVTPGFAVVPRQPAYRGAVFVVPGKPHGLVAGDGLTLFDIPSGVVRAHWKFLRPGQIQFDADVTNMLFRAGNDATSWEGGEYSSPARVHLVDLATGHATTVWDDDEEIEERCVTDAALHPSGEHVALLRQFRDDRERQRGSLAVLRPGRSPRWTPSEARSLTYSRRGTVLVSTEPNAVVLHHPRTAAVRNRIELEGDLLAWMHPTEEVAAVSTGTELVLLDLTDGQIQARTTFDGHSLAWSPDGSRVGGCGEDDVAHVFSAADLTPEPPAGNPVPCGYGVPDLRGRTAAYDGEVWRTGDAAIPFPGYHAAHPPDRPTWSLVGSNEAVSILNHAAGRIRPLLRSDRDAERWVSGVKMHPRGLEVPHGGTFGTVPTMEAPVFPAHVFPPPFTPQPELTQTSRDGRRRVVMAVNGLDLRVFLLIAGAPDAVALDMSGMEFTCQYGEDGTDCVAPVTFLPETLLLAGERSHYMHFDNAGNRLGSQSEVHDMQFIPDETGARFALVRSDGSVQLSGSDLRPTKYVLRPRGDHLFVRAVFAPGRSHLVVTRGASLVIADADGEVLHRVALPHPAVDAVIEGDAVRVQTAEELVWVTLASGATARTVEVAQRGASPTGSTRVLHCQRRELRLRDLATGGDIPMGPCPYRSYGAGTNETHAWWPREAGLELYRIADGARMTVRVFGKQRTFAVAYTPEGQVEMTDPSAASRVRIRAAGPVLDAALSDLDPATLVPGLVERYLAGEPL